VNTDQAETRIYGIGRKPIQYGPLRGKGGRPLRVLHVGNIANNAYVNAKLQREAGIDAYVLSYEYYHVMGLPEWEDANIVGQLDEFYPDLLSVDLGGYRRPDWFVNGPLDLCVQYLVLRSQGQTQRVDRLWRTLNAVTSLLIRYNLHRSRFRTAVETIWRWRELGWIGVRYLLRIQVRRVRNVFARIFPYRVFLLRVLSMFPQLKVSLVSWKRGTFGVNESPGASPDGVSSAQKLVDLGKAYGVSISISEAQDLFPDLALFRQVFAEFDVVQAYADTGYWPAWIGQHPYVAYEHATIRDIPFLDSLQGRLTALAFKAADAMIVTNADLLPQARRLQSESARIIHGLHGFDDRQMFNRLGWHKDRPRSEGRFGLSDGTIVFFAPARQHWKTGFLTWRKGNDRIVHAMKELAREFTPQDVRVVFAEWGHEVQLTKDLIAQLGVQDYFMWVPPIPKKDLVFVYQSVDAVIDQFEMACFGGVGFEVLALGACPLISRVDDEALREFYGETVPLLNCTEISEIVEAMKLVIKNPQVGKQVAQRCAAWMKKHHSREIVLKYQLNLYADLLQRRLNSHPSQ
jgi:glycosyltransferase involved in cell wall biosynthesis